MALLYNLGNSTHTHTHLLPLSAELEGTVVDKVHLHCHHVRSSCNSYWQQAATFQWVHALNTLTDGVFGRHAIRALYCYAAGFGMRLFMQTKSKTTVRAPLVARIAFDTRSVTP